MDSLSLGWIRMCGIPKHPEKTKWKLRMQTYENGIFIQFRGFLRFHIALGEK